MSVNIQPAVVTIQEEEDLYLNESVIEDVVEEIERPHLFVEGVEFVEEVELLVSKGSITDTSVPLYISFQGNPFKICMFDLSLDNLLLLRYLGYKVKLALPDGRDIILDDNPDIYVKFIRL